MFLSTLTVKELLKALKGVPSNTKIYINTGSDVYGDPNFSTDYGVIEIEKYVKKSGKNSFVRIKGSLIEW